MAAAKQSDFVLDAIKLDGVDVSRDEGNITAARDLTDGQIDLEDVLELGDKHGLELVNVVTDMQSAETRVVYNGGSE